MPKILEKFKRFEETIFFKKYNELEKQIQALQKLHDKYPNNEEIYKELKFCEAGLRGENEIEYELKNADIGMYVLHDINLSYNGSTAQIDYILFTPAYTYFLECKNLIGNITVDASGQFIREYTWNNKHQKESIYSPLTQAEKHIDIFNKIWKSQHENDFLVKILQPNINDYYKPLVVITNKKNLLNLENAPNNIKNNVIRADSLVSYIKNDIANRKKELRWTKKEMYKNAYKIMSCYNKDIKIDYEEKYKSLISDEDKMAINREEVKKRLLEFREKKHVERNIPIDYVFNDKELELILNKMPKSLIELTESNILSSVKLKFHGEEIINIIKKIFNECNI